jgi:hypothetical protein
MPCGVCVEQRNVSIEIDYRSLMALRVEVAGIGDVSIISPAAPEFDSIATSLLGRHAERVLPLKPLLAVVSNQSPHTIVAFTSEWKWSPNTSGATTTARSHMRFPDAVCGPNLGKWIEQGVPPGGHILVSMACSVQPQSLDYDDGEWFQQFVHEKEGQLICASTLRIGLDAVIFDNGVLVGADTGGLAERFGAHVRTKIDIYRLLKQRLSECNASEDFFAPVREMLIKSDDRHSHRDEERLEQNQAAAQVIAWQRRTLRAGLGSTRTEPFVIRRE